MSASATATKAGPSLAQWSLGRRLAVSFVLAALVLIASGVAVGVTLNRAIQASDAQVARYDPALLASQNLLNALLNQETGVRGYALSGNDQFLQPYTQGLADQAAAATLLRRYLNRDASLQAALADVLATAQTWQQSTAQVRIAQVRSGDKNAAQFLTDQADKARFDRIRSASATLTAGITDARDRANEHLHGTVRSLIVVLSFVAALFILSAFVLAAALRRWVQRPLARLGAETRIVASGQFDHEVRPSGPPDLQSLAADVEAMRVRITRELIEVNRARTELVAQSAALEQSNADLEQFAYVASHDLQEPLRKVSNFCQLLERQYSAQLDDRARQYIDFAVDGARRMQVLIQDLLGFSRVGRANRTFSPVDLDAATRQAISTLDPAITEAGADIRIEGRLPTVVGDQTLLTTLMQNLLANAIKYRATPPLIVTVAFVRSDDMYTVSVTDNGIGIDAAYAERIFVIFQRLHLRDEYGGTGIGLALCKKIVEYHGGQIWLDTAHTGGARFCYTIPDRSSL
jgi:signal transduction histidine kinase